MPSVHASLQERVGLVNKVKFVGSIPNVIRTNEIVQLLIHYYPYSSKILLIYSGTSPRYLFLVNQTTCLRERVGSGAQH